MEDRIKISVGACLLAENVRWNGGHARDGYLTDATGLYVKRETFIEQIFTLKRLRETLTQRKTLGNLVDFHTRHKLLMMSHSPHHYRIMGKLVAEGKDLPMQDLFDQYETLLMEALKMKTTLK